MLDSDMRPSPGGQSARNPSTVPADDSLPEILMIGPRPPPVGGQSVLIDNLLSGRLVTAYAFIVLDTAHQRPGTLRRVILTLRFAGQLLRIVRKHVRMRIAHVHTSAGRALIEKAVFIALLRASGRRVVLHVHGGRLREQWRRAGPLRRWLLRRLFESCSAIIVLSEHWRPLYRDAIGYRGRLHVLPNSVPVPALPERSPSRRLRIAYLGLVHRDKGLLDLANALRQLSANRQRQITVDIIGDSNSADEFTRVRQAFGTLDHVEVRFRGLLEGMSKWTALASSDIFVLPSHREDMPMSIIEALGVGLPVIATRVGSIPEMMPEGSVSKLIAPHSPDEIASAIEVLASDSALRARMGAAARRHYEKTYRFADFEQRLSRIYADVLAEA